MANGSEFDAFGQIVALAISSLGFLTKLAELIVGWSTPPAKRKSVGEIIAKKTLTGDDQKVLRRYFRLQGLAILALLGVLLFIGAPWIVRAVRGSSVPDLTIDAAFQNVPSEAPWLGSVAKQLETPEIAKSGDGSDVWIIRTASFAVQSSPVKVLVAPQYSQLKQPVIGYAFLERSTAFSHIPSTSSTTGLRFSLTSCPAGSRLWIIVRLPQSSLSKSKPLELVKLNIEGGGS